MGILLQKTQSVKLKKKICINRESNLDKILMILNQV